MQQSGLLLQQTNKHTSNIKRGTCILRAEPFMYILGSQYRISRCDFCLQNGKVFKCSGCQYVYYCNRDCQKSGWTIHNSECKGLQKIFPRTVPDAARMMARIISKLQKGGDLERGYYSDKGFRKFGDLMSHYSDIKVDPKRMSHIEALSGVLSEILSDALMPNESELIGIYGRLIINAFSICDNDMNSIGTGIYLAASIIDHSCKPNVVATFQGKTLNIHAIEDMPRLDWTKIRLCYIDSLKSTESRRDELKNGYYFLCLCPMCTNPDEVEGIDAAACLNDKCDAAVDIETDKCTKCKTPVTYEHRQKYKDAMEFTKTNLASMKEYAYLDICKICLSKQRNVLHSLNLWHVKTLDSAVESAILVNKWDDALDFGRKLIPGFRKYYGEWNPILGVLHLKVGKIQYQQDIIKEAINNLQHGINIISIVYGKSHEYYKEACALLLEASQMEKLSHKRNGMLT